MSAQAYESESKLWQERAADASKYGHEEMAQACKILANECAELAAECNRLAGESEPEKSKSGYAKLTEECTNIASEQEQNQPLQKKSVSAQAKKEEPDYLRRARRLRKTLEASEQHRTMCAEHGLDDSAIDATYEIQEIERELIELVKAHQKKSGEK